MIITNKLTWRMALEVTPPVLLGILLYKPNIIGLVGFSQGSLIAVIFWLVLIGMLLRLRGK